MVYRDVTLISVLTSFTASIARAVGVMLSEPVSFAPFGAVMV